ncbi:MFS transporter [Actinomyces wuliandei]|uniref:MFS transporter n=1 Tax=Actinomyces wuliandei TaxID=2057743 RepID=UPI000FD835BC|nr:MFS transporter [Actinomyces wuliandei]
MTTTTTSATRTGPNPWWVGIVSGMASYIDACTIVSAGIAFAIYQMALGLSDQQVGVLSGVLTFSIALGALSGGWLGDRFGRKHVFSVTMVMIVVGAALLVVAPGFNLLLVGTVLAGLGAGADLPVSLATIAESATDDNRGKIILLSNILWTGGIIGAITASSVVGNWGRTGAQVMFAHVGVVATVTLLGRLSLPESTTWLEARAERRAGQATVRAQRSSLTSLLTGPYAKPFYALIIFYSLINIPANTGGQFTTWIAVNLADVDVALNSRIALLTMPVTVLLAIWSMRIIDTPRRMPFFYAGAALFLTSLLIYPVLGFSLATLVAYQLVNMAGSAFAFEGIMKVWANECFPTLLRTTAQGTVIAVARVVAALAASVTPVLLRSEPRLFYLGLLGVAATGYAVAVWAFHGPQRNEFAVEAYAEADVAAGEEAGLDFTVPAEPRS